MLDDDFRYYRAHQAELAAQYEGKALVIKCQKVIGVYDSELQALKETMRDHELGSFLIQMCSADPDSVVRTFHSRVKLSGAESPT